MRIEKGSSFRDYPPRTKTAKSKAFEHALDIELMVIAMMEDAGITKKELAERMGILPSALSNLLNCQPNMTLETLSRFELALDATFTISLCGNAFTGSGAITYSTSTLPMKSLGENAEEGDGGDETRYATTFFKSSCIVGNAGIGKYRKAQGEISLPAVIPVRDEEVDAASDGEND